MGLGTAGFMSQFSLKPLCDLQQATSVSQGEGSLLSWCCPRWRAAWESSCLLAAGTHHAQRSGVLTTSEEHQCLCHTSSSSKTLGDHTCHKNKPPRPCVSGSGLARRPGSLPWGCTCPGAAAQGSIAWQLTRRWGCSKTPSHI